MAIDTPARIAIVGAGPIGLEAALYGRFLGYQVDIFERGTVADSIRRWGHVRMFSPWGMNISPLGRSALEAQDENWECPAADDSPTGREFVERYLLPLSRSDLVVDGLHEQTEVIKIGREDLLKGERIADAHRADTLFRLLVSDQSGAEHIFHADVVIDASGTFANHNALGVGGVPAVGELANESRIEYAIPDIEGADQDRYADRHTLVVGSGYSAATNVVALASLTGQFASTRVTWITRGDESDGPISRIPNDRLPHRDALAKAANELANNQESAVTHLAGTSVERLSYKDELDQFEVELSGSHTGVLNVHRVIANVGFQPDLTICSELQFQTCYASDGPIKVAASLLQNQTVDCLDQATTGADSLITTEPNFYVLGSKSYGRNAQFLIANGLSQIRELFSIIGDRADLDLYKEPEVQLGQ
ncbi:MAG: NAD(P)-binding domain-containing protein [Pirellulales bacterium]|nr:NAD(P)-binding domain-containing protein [Pirellulales bacterium]